MNKIALIFLLFPILLFSQDDLLNDLESDVVLDNTAIAIFKGLKVVNFESTKLASKKDLFLVVAHRFGSVKYGFDDFFGLDNAVTQIKFIYGVNEWLNIGVARSSFMKKYGVHAKYRLLQQGRDGFLMSVVGYNLVTANTSLDKDQFPNIEFNDRLTYTSQILLSRKFSESFSFLIAPTYIHDEDHNQFALGFGGRYKLAKRWSVNIDYGLHLNRNKNSSFRNPLSVGIDLETGGHVFQMHFTNAQAMFEEGYLVNAQGNWSEGDIFFGFNLSRVF
jgi:hypothetical protein